MVEQSANDMNETRAQPRDVYAGHQTLAQRVSGMENGVADRLDDLAKEDASLLAKLSAFKSTNNQTECAATADTEKKIHDGENKLDQSSKAEIQSVCQHLEQQTQTDNSNTKRSVAEAGSQQLLKKLLEVEKDVEGKVQETKKVDAERQRSETKAIEDLDAIAAAKARAIADLTHALAVLLVLILAPHLFSGDPRLLQTAYRC